MASDVQVQPQLLDRKHPQIISMTSYSSYSALLPPTAASITATLRKEEFTIHPESGLGVRQYDTVRVASNLPCEDEFTHAVLKDPLWKREVEGERGGGQDWFAWGIFDGHVSWEMAAQLRESLIAAVWEELKVITASDISNTDDRNAASKTEIDEAIKQAFLKLDKAVIDDPASAIQSAGPPGEVLARIKVASAGSCALLSLYDPTTQLLRVACVGDSRAVLGRKSQSADAEDTWEAIALSIDQTGKNTNEITRIESEHPNETDIVKGGRVLGIMVSRAFGDGFWKWDAGLQEELARTYFNGAYPKKIPFDGLKTPPYLTAEPVITTTKVAPEKGDFLIMASDGFWDHVGNEQAVGLVRKWVEWKEAGMPQRVREEGKDGEKVKRIDEERFEWHEGILTLQDENVATHLVRNALGGADEEFLQAVFSFDCPRSRNIRDDVTVQVIFFGDAE